MIESCVSVTSNFPKRNVPINNKKEVINTLLVFLINLTYQKHMSANVQNKIKQQQKNFVKTSILGIHQVSRKHMLIM